MRAFDGGGGPTFSTAPPSSPPAAAAARALRCRQRAQLPSLAPPSSLRLPGEAKLVSDAAAPSSGGAALPVWLAQITGGSP